MIVLGCARDSRKPPSSRGLLSEGLGQSCGTSTALQLIRVDDEASVMCNPVVERATCSV